MTTPPAPEPKDVEPVERPEAALERMYIDEYLQSRGYNSMSEMCGLPDDEIKQIMIEACKFASARLAEVEAKARFQRVIHG